MNMIRTNNTYCVYIHRNIITNKSYIGITVYGDDPNRRWQNGKGYVKQPYIYNAILKYGWDNFEHIIWATNLSENEAMELEIRLIALFDTTNSNFGYNVSPGGEVFSMDEVGIVKRKIRELDVKNQKRIQRSIIMFKDRYDNGDENILQCQKCGAYFEKNKNKNMNNKKRSAEKKKKYSLKRKYCDYCATYHKKYKKIINCVNCGKEFVIKSMDARTHLCDECKQIILK